MATHPQNLTERYRIGQIHPWDLLNHPDVPEDVLRELATGIWKLDVARHPKVPRDLLYEFAESPDSHVRYAVYKNLKTPPDILQRVSKSQDFQTCVFLAQNPNTPPEALLNLIKHNAHNVSIMTHIVGHPRINSKIFMVLLTKIGFHFACKHVNTPVLVWVKRNPRTNYKLRTLP